MKRSARWLLLFGMVAVGVAPAVAQTAPKVDIRIERDTRPRPDFTELGVHHIVTLADPGAGQPPAKAYEVFGQATNQAGEKSEYFDCSHTNDVDSRVPRGVYSCTVFVDHGGTWDFVAFVNERRCRVEGATGECVEREKIQTTVAQASVPFELTTQQVYTGDDEEQIKGSASDVALLWGHVLAAAGWFTCAAALAALALPELRRRMSSFGLNRFERRLDVLVKLAWSATAAVIGSGIFLMANETAYETPLSSSEVDAVFALPYAKPYFLALGAKLVLYSLMVPALALLVRGARRHLHVGFDMMRSGRPITRSSREAIQTLPVRGEGTLLTAPVDLPTEVQTAPAPLARLAVLVILLGALGISLCVALLKYFHQLIEVTRFADLLGS